MAKVDHTTSYYQKMAELQEKLKRSEEERFRLEEKFTIMMKSCREEEEKRIKALRERYERFIDDDKRRRDRNERILHTLEKIESRAAALSAKSERLKLLRKHYEAYLMRMYPLWKKQSCSVAQQPVLQHYPLSLPMDIDKGLSWFGNSSGLYINDLPLPSAQSSHSPGSERLWMPPVLSRSIHMYDNGNESVVQKPVEKKDTYAESCSPAVENALDNYIYRAAELLRVPVEELEGQSEKCDEEKSVHTEQDTSRDLLNVSLSDDEILLEKKKEKTAGNMAIINTKEKMVEEHKHDPQVTDYLAGGDNVLTMTQATKQIDRYQEQDILDKSEIDKNNDQNRPVKNKPDPFPSSSENGNMNKDVLENDARQTLQEPNKTKSDDESIDNQNCFQEGLKETCENLSQYYNVENVYDNQEQYVNTTQPENIDNANSHQNVNVLDSVKNTENINYDLRQEETHEKQENLEPNGVIQQDVNSDFPVYSENEGPLTPTVAPDGGGQLSTGALGEAYREDGPLPGGIAEAQYSNEQEYAFQNIGDPEQYGQEQYSDITVQQNEQYPNQYLDNPQQYEQEPYSGDCVQVYDQQYPEHFENEQYLDNTAQFEETQPTDDAYRNNMYGVSEEQYEGQNVDSSPQLAGLDNSEEMNAAGENIEQSLICAETVDPGLSAEEPLQFDSNSEGSQPPVPLSTEGGELYNTGSETPVTNNQKLNDDKVMNQDHLPSPPDKLIETTNSIVDQDLENQQETESDKIQQVAKEDTTEDNMGQTEIQPLCEGNAIEEPVSVANVDIPSNVEEDSEESSASFWNPPHHSSIPSVDELAPKIAAIVEDTSESSTDSKAIPPTSNPSGPNTGQEFRSLLGVPPEPSGDSSALSDLDEVEDQLAALVEDPTSSTPTAVKNKQGSKMKEEKKMEATQKANKEKSGTKELLKVKSEKESKSNKTSKSAKPSTRTGLKKPPSLIKVLESDTESLNLDTGGASNVDSDEFDFSTE